MREMSFCNRVGAAIVTAAAFTLGASGQVCVPNANFAVEGNSNNVFPFLWGSPMRYQQVYASNQFVPQAGLVTQIALRLDSSFVSSFSHNIGDIEISLSTTSAAPDGLSATFANNIGGDNLLVYDGALTLTSTSAPGPGNTRAFELLINLQSSFLYDPTAGNLLMDVRLRAPGILRPAMDSEGTTGDSISRVFASGNADATIGSPDTHGLITQFLIEPIPAPGGLAVLALGFASMGRRRRR